jgi:ATP:corrinoid adenosyltransferase
MSELETLEKDNCNIPLLFTEMFKDEINSNDEHKFYNGMKRVLKKYSQDKKSLAVLDEFTRVIAGGTSLDEIMQLAMDEALHPTMISDVILDNSCDTER